MAVSLKNTAPDPRMAWLAKRDRAPLVMMGDGNVAHDGTVALAPGEIRQFNGAIAGIAGNLPALSGEIPQNLAALNRANYIRLGRADLARRVRAGELETTDLLAEPDECMLTAKVFDVLQWQKRRGPTAARKLILGVCSETLRVEHCSETTTKKLIERLYAKRPPGVG